MNCTHCDKLNVMLPTLDQSLMLNRRISEVVVHAALVFQARKGLYILKPFCNLLNSPGELKV